MRPAGDAEMRVAIVLLHGLAPALPAYYIAVGFHHGSIVPGYSCGRSTYGLRCNVGGTCISLCTQALDSDEILEQKNE
jgi:hypothetical protein